MFFYCFSTNDLIFNIVSISISVMRETSDLIEKCGDGSYPSEAHCGGWEGLGKDGGEPAL